MITMIKLTNLYTYSWGFPRGLEGKASACNVGDPGSIPWLGRSTGEGNGNPLQYCCLENPMDGGARGRKELDTTERLHFPFHYTYSFPRKPPSHLPRPSYPARPAHSTELSSLCYTVACPQPSVLHVVVCTCQCDSLNSSHPLLLLLFPQVQSLPLRLFMSCREVHQYHFSRLRIYALLLFSHPVVSNSA